jgi:hypothetical protein
MDAIGHSPRMNTMHVVLRYSLTALLILCCGLFVGACRRGGVMSNEGGPTTEQLVQFYSPRSIKILPFTKPRSFDDDAIPDGIGASMLTLDGAGDEVKAYGTFIFELYAFRPGIAGHRGELIRSWTQPVLDIKQQKQFWERASKTYEFQLSWEGQPLTPQKKYVLSASFQAPGSERLFDEYEFEFNVQREEILQAISGVDGKK